MRGELEGGTQKPDKAVPALLFRTGFGFDRCLVRSSHCERGKAQENAKKHGNRMMSISAAKIPEASS